MKIAWSRLALDDFEDATDDIAKDNPQAAHEVVTRILEATQRLCEYPYIGHQGDDPEQREWLVSRTPYVLIYEIDGDTVYVARVWHTRRRIQ